jgi:hypothetical protein
VAVAMVLVLTGALYSIRAKKLCVVSMAVAMTVSALIGGLVFTFARELGT